MQQLAKANALPDMVQIGNEVNGGMIWPMGSSIHKDRESRGFDGFAALLKQAFRPCATMIRTRTILKKRLRS